MGCPGVWFVSFLIRKRDHKDTNSKYKEQVTPNPSNLMGQSNPLASLLPSINTQGSSVFPSMPSGSNLNPDRLREMLDQMRSIMSPEHEPPTPFSIPNSPYGVPMASMRAPPPLYGMSPMGPVATPPLDPPAVRFAGQLTTLEEMGFSDRPKNIRALLAAVCWFLFLWKLQDSKRLTFHVLD